MTCAQIQTPRTLWIVIYIVCVCVCVCVCAHARGIHMCLRSSDHLYVRFLFKSGFHISFCNSWESRSDKRIRNFKPSAWCSLIISILLLWDIFKKKIYANKTKLIPRQNLSFVQPSRFISNSEKYSSNRIQIVICIFHHLNKRDQESDDNKVRNKYVLMGECMILDTVTTRSDSLTVSKINLTLRNQQIGKR